MVSANKFVTLKYILYLCKMKYEDIKNEIDKNLSINEIAINFKCSKSNIRYWLKKYNLKTKFTNKINNGWKCIICNNSLNGNKRLYCSNNCKQKSHYEKIKNQPNTYHNQTIRYLKRKIEFINLLGGKCSNCGYFKNITALEFHHINPKNKLFSLDSRKLANGNKIKLMDELKKCTLLCSNCHRELHNKEMDLTNVVLIIKNGPVSALPHKQ